MKKVGIDPAMIYAFEKTGLIVTEDNQNLRTPKDAAVKAIQWSRDRQAEVFAEPADDRIREAEVLEWQLDDQITVNETGFGSRDDEIFDTVELAAVREHVVRRT